MKWALPAPACPTADDRSLRLLFFLLPAALVEYQGEVTQAHAYGKCAVSQALAHEA